MGGNDETFHGTTGQRASSLLQSATKIHILNYIVHINKNKPKKEKHSKPEHAAASIKRHGSNILGGMKPGPTTPNKLNPYIVIHHSDARSMREYVKLMDQQAVSSSQTTFPSKQKAPLHL